MSSLRKYIPDSVIFILLLIIGLKLSYDSGNITDIDPFDESIYLYRGTTLSPFIKHHLDGFFYYLWYNILSLFTADNFELFFLNNSILLVLPGLLMFAFFRVLKVNLLLAFVSALIFLLSSANIFVIPIITKFALCVILSGLIIIYKTKGIDYKLLGAVILSFVSIYLRPEFILTFFATTIIYLMYVLKDFKNKTWQDTFKKMLPVLFMIFVIVIFNPISRHRANIAFAQHYSRDILERENDTTLDLDHITRPDEIMQQDFSTDYSMSDAFLNNPKLFFEHIGFNIYRIYDHIDDAIPYFITQNENPTLRKLFYVFFILILIFTCYFIYIGLKKRNYGIFSLIFILFFIPHFLSVLVFYPRVHYMIFIIAFLLICFSYEVSLRFRQNAAFGRHSFSAAVIAALLSIVLVPFRAGSESIHETGCTRLHTAKELNKLKFKDSVNFFTVGPGILTFLTNDWKYISDELLKEPVGEFFHNNDVNLILVNNYFFNHPLIINNIEIDKVLSDTAFVKIDITGCKSYLLARKDILR